jgi:hypothetical protein
LYDVTGALVYSVGAVTSIDVSTLVSGVYLMKITSSEGTVIAKKVLVN